MNIASFDIFDTLLTRQYIHPTGIFLNVGTALDAMGYQVDPSTFMAQRIQAEANSFKVHKTEEVTFGQILAELDILLGGDKQLICDIERLELEAEIEMSQTVPYGIQLLENARNECDQVIFVSDMYLPGKVIKQLLVHHDLWQQGDMLFVSSDTKLSKRSGNMYKFIEKKFPKHSKFLHHGDNFNSDIQQARNAGWGAVHLPDSLPIRYEQAPQGSDDDLTLLKLLGNLKQLRLNLSVKDLEPEDHALYILGTHALGPLLSAYAISVANWCKEDSIQQLYCLSRDGQILKLVLDKFLAAGITMPESVYFHTSRQALRGSEFAITNNLPLWITQDIESITLDTLLNRLDMSLDHCTESLLAYGITTNNQHNLLTKKLHSKALTWLNSEQFLQLYKKACKEKLVASYSYFKTMKFTDIKRTAICDVGWVGSLQESISQIVNNLNSTNESLTGYLVGYKGDGESALSGYTRSVLSSDNLLCNTNSFSEILELCLSADHAPVKGYSISGDNYVPHFHDSEPSARELEKISLVRRGVSDFIDSLLENTLNYQELDQHVDSLQAIGEDNFYKLVTSPTEPEAVAFGEWCMSKNVTHTGTIYLAPDLTLFSALKTGLLSDCNASDFWPQGLTVRHGKVTTQALFSSISVRKKLTHLLRSLTP